MPMPLMDSTFSANTNILDTDVPLAPRRRIATAPEFTQPHIFAESSRFLPRVFTMSRDDGDGLSLTI
jgi:hypothetical protein